MAGYDEDFALWARRQARLLSEHRFHELDVTSLAEEVDSMATRLVTEIEWHMQPLLSHLLRWKCFEGLRCDNWLSVTTEHRIWIGGVLEDAPSLKATLPEMIERLWLNVTLELHKSMGLNFDLMPTKCPWTVDEMLTVGLLTK